MGMLRDQAGRASIKENSSSLVYCNVLKVLNNG